MAREGEPSIDLPRPMRGKPGCDFSFSGLKTAVRRAAAEGAEVADLCASFQSTVADVLDDRVGRALRRYFEEDGRGTLVVAGGVAANRFLRARLEALAERHGHRFVAPPPKLCTDNAAMIAHAGALRLLAGLEGDATPRSRWPLDGDAAPRVGFGRRGPKA